MPIERRSRITLLLETTVELTDQLEEASGSGLDVRRQLGDLVAQPADTR